MPKSLIFDIQKQIFILRTIGNKITKFNIGIIKTVKNILNEN